MRFTVGGQEYDLSRETIIEATSNLPVETIRTHVVEIEDQVYPPKQVFAAATGRPRQSFTTFEAQRVLNRLGFVCRRVGMASDGALAWEAIKEDAIPKRQEEVDYLLATLGTIQAAIAGLQRRVSDLEAARVPMARQ